MATVACISCGTTLTPHCESKGCHWWECNGVGCEWIVYDLDTGARRDIKGHVERLFPHEHEVPD